MGALEYNSVTIGSALAGRIAADAASRICGLGAVW
jgi:hypothetical protein